MLSEIGGTVGLYIGFSAITLCEFGAVVLVLLRYVFKKYHNGKENSSPRRGQGENDDVNTHVMTVGETYRR